MVTNVDDIYAAKESDGITGITENVKGNLVAEKINYGAIYYEKFDDIVEEPLGLCEDEEYVIYYVTEEGYEKLTDINDVVGKYVFGFQDENCECTDVNNVLFVIDLKD